MERDSKRKFIGCVAVESLDTAKILDSLTPVVERVAEVPDDPDATTWHVRWYSLDEESLRRLLPSLAQAMRPQWYAHFWANDDLCVILAGRYFWAKASDKTTWQEFIAYGDTVGIERKWTERIPTDLPDYVAAALACRPA